MEALKDPRGIVRFDEAELLFDAPTTSPVLEAREATMRRCLSDASIAAFARTAQRSDAAWLITTIESLVAAPTLRDRALGLALAAFSRQEPADFERFVGLADIEGTWVADVVPALRRNHRRDVLAGMWFERFWAETAHDAAWVALQVVAHLADQRFEQTFGEVQATSQEGATRSRMIEMNRFVLKPALKGKRDRKDRLFGMRIQKDQIFPFIGNAAIL